MTTDLKRALALKEFLNEEYFVVGDKAYEGTMDEADDLFSEADKDLGWTTLKFEDFVDHSFTEVEELSARDERSNYIVLTDEEADEMWEEQLDSYLEECIYDSLPDWVRGYFDDEAWKRDAKMDGRGHSLATYDGHEHYERVFDTDFYIYRIN
jgi:hypothetical protein